MQITRIDPWTISLKTKNATARINGAVVIGSITIDGPGEYDVAGISVRGLQCSAQTVYIVQAEDLKMAIVPRVPETLSSDQLEQIGIVDIAVVPVVAGGQASDSL